MELRIGQRYKRPCAVVRMDDGREYLIPVIDHRHADPQFGYPHEHYHIDGRFYIHPRMAHEYGLKQGFTGSVVKTSGNCPEFLRMCKEEVECVRLETGLSFPAMPNEKQRANLLNYEKWYSSYIGKSCAGRKCPHYGTEMLESDGKLVCPMHHLTANARTCRIIARDGRPIDHV